MAFVFLYWNFTFALTNEKIFDLRKICMKLIWEIMCMDNGTYFPQTWKVI